MNKNKFSIKTIIIIVILVLVGILGVLGVSTAKTYLSGASGETMPKNVLAKVSEDGKSATVTWVTDKSSVGIVEYGTNAANLLLRAPESDQASSHTVTLSSLKANQKYYYQIRVGDEVFNNEGIPYLFETKTAVTPTLVPTVAMLPTAVPATSSGTSTCDRTTDYNKDGIVNSLDYMSCLKGGATTISTGVTPTVSSGSGCDANKDYNNDGVINSLDRLKCLQDNK